MHDSELFYGFLAALNGAPVHCGGQRLVARNSRYVDFPDFAYAIDHFAAHPLPFFFISRKLLSSDFDGLSLTRLGGAAE
jgi:hypothetical protein